MLADCRVSSRMIAHRRFHCVLARHGLVWVERLGDRSVEREHHRSETRTYYCLS